MQISSLHFRNVFGLDDYSRFVNFVIAPQVQEMQCRTLYRKFATSGNRRAAMADPLIGGVTPRGLYPFGVLHFYERNPQRAMPYHFGSVIDRRV